MDIHRTQIRDFILPKIKSVYIVDYYEAIRSLLQSRDEFPYQDFLARPRTRTQTEIQWSSNDFTDKPMLFSDLPEQMKETYASSIKNRIRGVERVIESLRNEEGGKDVVDFLSKTLSYIDERSVYCGEGHVAVINWGMIPRQPSATNGIIYKDNGFSDKWKCMEEPIPSPAMAETSIVNREHENPIFSDKHPDRIADVYNPEPAFGSAPVLFGENDDAVRLQEAKERLLQEQERLETLELEIKRLREEQTKLEQARQQHVTKEMVDSESEADSELGTKSNKEEQIRQEPEPEKEKDKQETTSESDSAEKKKRFSWWWLLIIILALFLLLFLGRDYQGSINRFNPFFRAFPPESRLLPLTPEGIGLSSDGHRNIATDRLNILLEHGDENTMREWAKAFKKAYPSKDFFVFYYNEELDCLQIKVPVDQRENVKNELNDKLSDFNFSVYEESIHLSSSLSLNDDKLLDKTATWYLNAIEAFAAWNYTMGEQSVIVAVVDNGFDLNHPELQGKIVNGYNAYLKNNDIHPLRLYDGTQNGHGTHVAATAAGNSNNGQGLLGIAPLCKLMPIQTGLENGTSYMSSVAIQEGTLYAINHNADVINLSIGIFLTDYEKSLSENEQLNYISSSYREEELIWNKIVNKAKEKNCVIVFAAGNDNCISGMDYKKRNPNTIIVSSVGPDLTKSSFSNYGRYPSLGRIYSTVSAPGELIYSATPDNSYAYKQGTSMASPVVAGAVALLKSIDKTLTVEQIIDILEKTGTEIDPSIGPLINLRAAVSMLCDTTGGGDCEHIRSQIQYYQYLIDSLARLCPYTDDDGSDTLKYNDAVKDPNGLNGKWKTTTSLVSTSDQSPVELYMEFKGNNGTLYIINNGVTYTAPLKLRVENGKVLIDQKAPASSNDSETTFKPYKYVCSPDQNGNFLCTATSDEMTVKFNLVRC